MCMLEPMCIFNKSVYALSQKLLQYLFNYLTGDFRTISSHSYVCKKNTSVLKMLVCNMTGMSNCRTYITIDSDLFLPKYQYFCLR